MLFSNGFETTKREIERERKTNLWYLFLKRAAPAAAPADEHHEAQGADILKVCQILTGNFYIRILYSPVKQHRQDQKRAELDEQLKEYIAEWRKQRVKEEEELKKLKEKQAKRKVPNTFLLILVM